MGKPRDSRNHGVLKKWREKCLAGVSETREKLVVDCNQRGMPDPL